MLHFLEIASKNLLQISCDIETRCENGVKLSTGDEIYDKYEEIVLSCLCFGFLRYVLWCFRVQLSVQDGEASLLVPRKHRVIVFRVTL